MDLQSKHLGQSNQSSCQICIRAKGSGAGKSVGFDGPA